MHIYAFGSICRGDISIESDIDLLALLRGRDARLDKEKFSIYSYGRIRELWTEGNAFAWHLALESKLIYSEDGENYLEHLGMPSEYANGRTDCARFREVFESSLRAIESGTPSLVFELSTTFLALRNLATCYSLAALKRPTFGRHSAKQLGEKSLSVSEDTYAILVRARLLSTRGVGSDIEGLGNSKLISDLHDCRDWINELCKEVESSG